MELADTLRLGRNAREGMWVRVPPFRQKIMEEITLKEYLWKEFRFSTLPKYYVYFEEWFDNLTENQYLYLKAYKEGGKSLFVKFK